MTRSEWLRAWILTAGLSGILAAGFVPTSAEFFHYLVPHLTPPWDQVGQMLSFPLLALFFYLSLPRGEETPRQTPSLRGRKAAEAISSSRLGARGLLRLRLAMTNSVSVPVSFCVQISVLPVVLALLCGLFRPGPKAPLALLWYVFSIPVGEELLFRGWIYGILSRRWPQMASDTNPLPVALWLSAAAFAIWHLQNLTREPLTLVVFQLLYTFLTGVWLGYLRWKTGKLLFPVLGHIAVNLSAGFLLK